MTITPDQARALLDGARPGPWHVYTDPDDPDGTFIYDDMGNMCIAVEPAGSDYLEADLTLAAAAPDLAQTIAGMTWEYAVEHEHTPGKWHRVTEWGPEANPYQPGHVLSDDERIVRCLVGPREVVEGE